MKYILGVDQGGSKTIAIVCDNCGNILGVGKSGGAVHSSDGLDYAITIVKKAVDKALQESGIPLEQISVFCAGISGVDWDYEEGLLENALRKAIPVETIQVTNDCMVALRAGIKKSRGAILCAGSGLNCAIQKDLDTKFIYGFYIDDEYQGGFSLGRAAVRAVIEAQVNLSEKTRLTQILLDYFKLETVDQLLYMQAKSKITGKDYLHIPMLLERAAKENDVVALGILADYGTNIAKYVTEGMRKFDMLDEDIDVILSGSIFKCTVPTLKDAVSLGVHRYAVNAKIVDAVYEPVVGAVLLGLDSLYRDVSDEVYDNIEQSASHFMLKRASEQFLR